MRAIIFALGLALAFNANADTDGVYTRFDPENASAVEAGRQVYAEHCAACHGENLEGQENWRSRDDDSRLLAPPHNETGHTWHHDDDTLFELVKYGLAKVIGDPGYESNMPAYEEVLSDEQINNVMSFILSTWPTRFKDIQADRTKTAADYFESEQNKDAQSSENK